MAAEAFKAKKSDTKSKGNSGDSIQVIYILSILKKYSSPKNPLSSQDVMDYLGEYYPGGRFEKSESLKKKIRRYLDTLHESYCKGCIRKIEGNTRISHKWYYDVSRDRFKDGEGVAHETLTETEVELLVDLISSTKILNSEGTLGLIDKLLMKTSISYEDRVRRLGTIQKEAWLKTPNEDLAEKKSSIEESFFLSDITFDYEAEESVTATPLGWIYEDGICYLDAEVKGKRRKFSLDKIRVYGYGEDENETPEDDGYYEKETDSDKTALDSLFVNIPTIRRAIADKKCLHFMYRSYVVDNGKVIPKDEAKSILPHSMTFNDGKYYLIGINANTKGLNKVLYFRVDLMFELYCTKPKIKLSDWDKYLLDTTERARVVEKHPLMLAGTEIMVTFKVVESALDRVVDAFAVTRDKFKVTEETRKIKDFSEEGSHEERLVTVDVRTTAEEAYRWALENADAVELVYPTYIRHRLRRMARPIHNTYIKTVDDKVQSNIDRVLSTGTFKITRETEGYIAYQTFKALKDSGNNDAVNSIEIHSVDADKADYLNSYVNSKRLEIFFSKCRELKWISDYTKLVNIDFHRTSIEDVSWLARMKDLKILRLKESPISDLSVLREHRNLLLLELRDLDITDISFLENKPRLFNLRVTGCPVEDYSVLLRIPPLDILEIDEKAAEALGIENLVKHHPDARIEVKQKIDNRKV